MKREIGMPVVIVVVAVALLAIIVAGWFYLRERNPAPPKYNPTGPAPENTQKMVEPQV